MVSSTSNTLFIISTPVVVVAKSFISRERDQCLVVSLIAVAYYKLFENRLILNLKLIIIIVSWIILMTIRRTTVSKICN